MVFGKDDNRTILNKNTNKGKPNQLKIKQDRTRWKLTNKLHRQHVWVFGRYRLLN